MLGLPKAPWLPPTWLRSACCLLGLVLLVAGCGDATAVELSENSSEVAHPAGPGQRELAAAVVPTRSCRAGVATVGSSRIAIAAFVKSLAVVRKAPDARAPEVIRLRRLNRHGFREVLSVIGVRSNGACAAAWYHVGLSVLPNGTTGWVRPWAVETYRVRARIVVDVSERRLRLFRSGKLALETPVAIGASVTPTPLGHYIVNERYILPDATGPFGPNVLGISAHSDALKDVWVEDGPIGIHGTNAPQSIGQAASHGCVRIENTVMRRIFPLAPAGTPVIVKA
jgi:lipoprotein-anchoring transpeptidase ErfK/SrfK